MYLNNLLTVATLALGANARVNITQAINSLGATSLLKLLGSYPDVVTQLDAAKGITLLAPSNDAIAQLTKSGALNSATQDEITAILSYHVIGESVSYTSFNETPVFLPTTLTNSSYTNVTGGQVVEGALVGQDVVFTSGLKLASTVVIPPKTAKDFAWGTGGTNQIHLIDQVLTVPPNVSTTALAAGLSALAGALTATDLLSTVDGLKDVTIFAPSNAAFQAIGSAAGNLSTTALTSILEYHVIQGTVAYSSSLSNGSVTTLGGSDVNITIADGAVFVNAARVIIPDILVAGGVIHVIDSVLNPNGTAQPKPNTTKPVVQYSGASSASLGALTSGIPTPTSTNTALVAATTTPKPTKGGSSGGSSSSSGIAAQATGMIGAAALFGGAALVANW